MIVINTEIKKSSQFTPAFQKMITLLPPAILAILLQRPALFLCTRIAVLLSAFIVVDHFMMRAGDLSTTSYGNPYLGLELLKRLGVVGIAICTVLTVILIRYGRLLCRWDSLELGNRLRGFIVFLAMLMAWPFATYGYNYYFDQGHYIDRTLIALLVLLIWFRPVFIYPFLLLIFATMWQLAEPTSISGSIFAHKLQVLHVLNLFAAAFLLHAATGCRRTDDLLFLTCCLVASAYWEAGLAKLELNWITFGHLYLLPLAAYAHGWLAFFEPSAIVAFAKTLSWFDLPMRIAVLVIEVGCLLFLWRRSVSILLLFAVMVFHVGVFVLYGFLFWTWILLDAALLGLLLRDRRSEKLIIYSRPHLLLSVLLIASASVWAKPPHLGWFDTRLTYTYQFEAVSASGEKYLLPPSFFAPYEDSFTMSSFGYLVKEHGILVAPYGVTKSRVLADELMNVKTPDKVFVLETQHGVSRYDPGRAKRFYEFLGRYVANRNARGEKATTLYALHPPRQFWSFARGEVYNGREPIREVIVKEITTLYDDVHLVVIRELELARITIPGA